MGEDDLLTTSKSVENTAKVRAFVPDFQRRTRIIEALSYKCQHPDTF